MFREILLGENLRANGISYDYVKIMITQKTPFQPPSKVSKNLQANRARLCS